MDYEKKYNEALERASKLRVQNPFDTVSQMMEHVFPELADSEDERIRKFLHHTFTVQYLAKDKLGKWHGEPVSNILAWLEKQGVTKFNVGDVIRQTDKPEYTYTIREIKDGCYICDTCDFSTDNPLLELVKKKEWSEEDEKIIQWIATDIKRLINDNKKANIIADQEIKWLESIRPRSQWKPSDEQIGALEHFVRSIAESGFASPYDSNTKLVYSLFNDLKKLK